MKLVTRSQMQRIDALTIHEYGVPSLVLMENAGLGAFRVIMEEYEGLKGMRVAVIAGGGNNGGDGLVVARWLYCEGIDTSVYIISKRMSNDCRVNFEIAKRMGLPIFEMDTDERLDEFSKRIRDADLLVDAIFGTGISEEVKGYPARVIEFINTLSSRIVAIDLPSGLDPDMGRPLGVSVRAHLTITFGLMKRGLFLFPGRELAGKVRLVRIGIPPTLLTDPSIKTELLVGEDLFSLLPTHPYDAHKGMRGKVLVVAGSRGMSGAAILCCEGALRIGPGLVYLCIPKSLNDVMEIRLTEVITHPLKETQSGSLDIDAFDGVMELAKGCEVLAIGPGIGRDPRTIQLTQRLIKEVRIPIVVDADGINAISLDPSSVKERRSKDMVLTPHPGEAARLLCVSTKDIQDDRIGWASKISNEFGVVCVLKGAATLISYKDDLFINPTGNPGMASGGVGDVLTGMIAGLIAQGLTPLDAARLGVYLHGLAGDIMTKEKTPYSLTASDLIIGIPKAINSIKESGHVSYCK